MTRLLIIAALACLLSPRAFPQASTQFLWFDAEGLTRSAREMLDAMQSAQEWGLDPRDYDAAQILSGARGENSIKQQERLDSQISREAGRFVQHLHYGRIDPKTVGFDMPPRPGPFDVGAVLAKLAANSETREVLAGIEPPFQHYSFLKTQLARYRQLAKRPELTRLPPLGSLSIEPGMRYVGAAHLRELLVALGDLSDAHRTPDTELLLDPRLVKALRNFQFRHGLQQDGVLGRRTYTALTTPINARIGQIELTLERWRWLPVADAPTIIVNIPQFRLFAFASGADHESQMLTMDVIVGQTYPRTRTPAFAADLKYIVFRPYWDVPYGIMSREMLADIRTHPGYLAAHDLEVLGTDGDSVPTQHPNARQIAALATGRLRVRQRPGAENSLGLVKFMLPNPYNVYLHATPAQELFQEARRAFSHGCIRVSDPVALAEYVLRQAPGEWSRERIVAAMHGTTTQRVDLERGVRVLIVYGTAVATEKGLIYFFDDLYGNDTRLAQALARQERR